MEVRHISFLLGSIKHEILLKAKKVGPHWINAYSSTNIPPLNGMISDRKNMY